MDINKRNLEETKARGEQNHGQEQKQEQDAAKIENNDSSKLILIETRDSQQF